MSLPLDRTTYSSVDALLAKLEALTNARVMCLIDDTVQSGWGVAHGPHHSIGHNLVIIPGVAREHRHVVAVTHVLDLIHAIEHPPSLAYVDDEDGVAKSRAKLAAAARPRLKDNADSYAADLVTGMARMLRQGLRNISVQQRVAREFPDLRLQHLSFCRSQVNANDQPLTIASRPRAEMPDWFRLPVRRVILAETLGLSQITGEVHRWLIEALDSKASDARDARRAVEYLADPDQAAMGRKTAYNFTLDYSRYPYSLIDWVEASHGDLSAGEHHWGTPAQIPIISTPVPPPQPAVQPSTPYHLTRQQAADANNAGDWGKARELFTGLMECGGSADPLVLVGRATAAFKLGDHVAAAKDAQVARSLASHEEIGESARILLSAIYQADLRKVVPVRMDLVMFLVWAQDLMTRIPEDQGRRMTLEALLVGADGIDPGTKRSYMLKTYPDNAMSGLQLLALAYAGIRLNRVPELGSTRPDLLDFGTEWQMAADWPRMPSE